MIEGALARLARAVAQRATPVLGLAVVVAVLAALVGLPPRIDSGNLRLFPPDEPLTAALVRSSEQAGGATGIYLVFEARDAEAVGPALDALAEDLDGLDTVRFAFHRLPERLGRHVALMQLDPTVMGAFATRLEQAVGFGSALNPFLASRILQMPAVDAELERARSATLWFPDDGYSRVFVKPRRSHFHAESTRDVVRQVRKTLEAADPELTAAGLRLVAVAGPYANFAAGLEGVVSDLVWTSVVSAVLVLAVLVFGMRSARAPLLVVPPLVLAALLNLAFLQLAFGAVTTYTSVGNALLVGLGIDVAVHLLARIREARASGLGIEDAVAEAWRTTGPACLTAGLTSTAGFLALGVFRFRGLAELGYSLAFGMLTSLTVMLVLLPAMVVWLDPSPPAPATEPPDHGSGGTSISPAGARVALGVAIVATLLVSVLALPRLEFNYDFSAVGRDDATYSLLDEAGRKHMRDALPPVVVTLDDAADLPAEHARLVGLVDGGQLPMVQGVLSLESLLPNDQSTRVRALERIRSILQNPDARFLPPAVQQALAPLRDWEPRVLGVDALPPGLGEYFLYGRRLLLLARGDLYDLRVSTELVAQLEPHVEEPASDQLLQSVLLRTVFEDLRWVAGLAFLAVVLLTSIDARRPGPVLAVVGALTAGLLWAGSLAGVLGIRLNLANIVALPILLGIGIDVVVHLMHRLRTEASVRRAFATVGVAAGVSTLTTVASFVALTASGSGGVRSLGQLVVLGLLTTTSVSALLLGLGAVAIRRDP